MSVIPATITAIERRTPDISALQLMPDAPFIFEAGQYLEITVPGHDPRAYSIANAPRRDNALSLHIRDLGHGLSHWLCGEAKIGDAVQISGPSGTMRADMARGRPVFMIGGGTGVVPLLSIAEDIVRRGITEDGIELIYGVRMAQDIHCRRELDTLLASGELTLHEAIGHETPDVTLSRLAPRLAGHTVYISGPDPMLFNILPLLKKYGLEDGRLFTDTDIQVLTGSVS